MIVGWFVMEGWILEKTIDYENKFLFGLEKKTECQLLSFKEQEKKTTLT